MWDAVFIYNIALTIMLAIVMTSYYLLYIQKSTKEYLYLTLLFFFMVMDNSLIYTSEYSENFRNLYFTSNIPYLLILGCFVGIILSLRGVAMSQQYMEVPKIKYFVAIGVVVLFSIIYSITPHLIGEILTSAGFFGTLIYYITKLRPLFERTLFQRFILYSLLTLCITGIVESSLYFLFYAKTVDGESVNVFFKYRNLSFDAIKIISIGIGMSILSIQFRSKGVTTKDRVEIYATSHDLTERQKEILGLIVDGASNRDIASSLHITEGTVKTHIHNIFHKLGVTSRNQIIAKVLQNKDSWTYN